MKINPNDRETIVKAYTIEFIPMIELARRYNVTRMAIWKLLNAVGVDTTKQAAHIKTICDNCGKETSVIRSVISKRLHSFCNHNCYYAWLKREEAKHPLLTSRHCMRIARQMVEKSGFFVENEMVVHHEDRNETNNELHNLKVFASQGDHVQYHRGFTVLPLWEGTNYTNQKPINRKKLYLSGKEKICSTQ